MSFIGPILVALYIVGAILFGLPAGVQITGLYASTMCKMLGQCRWWIVLSLIPVFIALVATYPLWAPWAIARAENGDERFVPDDTWESMP